MSISDVELAIVLEMLRCALVCKGKKPIQDGTCARLEFLAAGARGMFVAQAPQTQRL